jgi:hypothetical protein
VDEQLFNARDTENVDQWPLSGYDLRLLYEDINQRTQIKAISVLTFSSLILLAPRMNILMHLMLLWMVLSKHTILYG